MKRTPLRRISKAQVKRLGTYFALRKSYLQKHPVCELPECNAASFDIHHKSKRGKNLNAVDTWMAVCRSCHDKIESNKSWARKHGYLENI